MSVRLVPAVVLVVVAVLASCGNEPGPDRRSDAGVAEAATATWERLPDPPLHPRRGAAIGWTGLELVAFGGSTFLCPPAASCVAPTTPPFADGAALDPKTRTWRRIADAPVPVAEHLVPVTLGGDVYVVAPPWPADDEQASSVLLRYRSADDTWDQYPLPSAWRSRGLEAAGSSLVVYPTSDERGELPDLRFDPERETWTELPPDPLSPAFDRRYVWTGDRLHLFAKAMTPSPGGESGPSVVQAARLDGESWTRLPDGDLLSFWSVIEHDGRVVSIELGCADGGATNNYGRCIPFGGIYDAATETWSTLPDAPRAGEKDVRSSGAITDDKVLITQLGHPMLDLTTDTWFELPRIDPGDKGDGSIGRTVVGAGPYALAVGGSRFDPAHPAGALLEDAWLWSPRG